MGNRWELVIQEGQRQASAAQFTQFLDFFHPNFSPPPAGELRAVWGSPSVSNILINFYSQTSVTLSYFQVFF